MNKIFFLASLPSWVVFLILVPPFYLFEKDTGANAVASLILVCWVFVVGLALEKSAAGKYGHSFKLFIFSLLCPLSVMVYKNIMLENANTDIFNIVTFVCFFYSLFHVTHRLVMAEEKKVWFSKLMGTMFLFFFFPIGIWFLQPRIKTVLQTGRSLKKN